MNTKAVAWPTYQLMKHHVLPLAFVAILVLSVAACSNDTPTPPNPSAGGRATTSSSQTDPTPSTSASTTTTSSAKPAGSSVPGGLNRPAGTPARKFLQGLSPFFLPGDDIYTPEEIQKFTDPADSDLPADTNSLLVEKAKNRFAAEQDKLRKTATDPQAAAVGYADVMGVAAVDAGAPDYARTVVVYRTPKGLVQPEEYLWHHEGSDWTFVKQCDGVPTIPADACALLFPAE